MLCIHSSFAVISMGKRELVALLCLSSWCLVIVVWLFFTMPRGCLPFVIVVSYSLFLLLRVEYLCVEYKRAFNIKVQLHSICLVYPSTCRSINTSTRQPIHPYICHPHITCIARPQMSIFLSDHHLPTLHIICPVYPSTPRVNQSSYLISPVPSTRQHVDKFTPISTHPPTSPVLSDRTSQQVFTVY